MNSASASRIELIGKDNFDTWKLQMQAVLIKGNLWEYVNGIIVKPEQDGKNANAAAIEAWRKKDLKVKSAIGHNLIHQHQRSQTGIGDVSGRATWNHLTDNL